MNCLYLSLINIEKKTSSGVNKKIEGQIKAMERQGLNMYRIALKNSGLYAFNNGKEILLKENFFSKKYEFIEKRVIYYRTILGFVKKQNIEVIYVRYQLSDPFFIKFIRNCKKRGLKIFLEVATYPYDKEIGGLTIYIDNFFKRFLHKYIDNVITYSDHKTIFGVQTIKIANGIDLDFIKVPEYNKDSDVINLIGVASVSKWHGFDRVIKSLAEYYNNNVNNKEVFFHIVGDGPELENLKVLTKQLNLVKYIIFHGFKSGEELDEIFNKCDIGIGSLGMYRIGLKNGYTLKLREYCARGLPFVYGYFDNDFADFKYSITVSNDNKVIDIKKVIDFYSSIRNKNYVNEMREYAKVKLSWDAKMQSVIKKILNVESYSN
jgi:hypothetical protein